ncbi:MAG: hypothetical protein Q8P16_02690 [bacterium]|nr:hypothetical protein [bacterium]
MTKVRIFIVVFVVAFLTNVAVAFLWDRWFHESSWRFDVSSATAVAVAGAVTLTVLLSRRRRRKEEYHE